MKCSINWNQINSLQLCVKYLIIGCAALSAYNFISISLAINPILCVIFLKLCKYLETILYVPTLIHLLNSTPSLDTCVYPNLNEWYGLKHCKPNRSHSSSSELMMKLAVQNGTKSKHRGPCSVPYWKSHTIAQNCVQTMHASTVYSHFSIFSDSATHYTSVTRIISFDKTALIDVFQLCSVCIIIQNTV